jgi:undecaprenyl phosphate N,N'-diacetylbacillosamine 1-phosphate transferase
MRAKTGTYVTVIKPLSDLVFAFFLLVILSPVFAFVSILLAGFNKGRIFFLQQRIGLNEKPFFIYKFKTLNDKKAVNGKLLPDNERQSLLGNFLRGSHIDEIPQLLNVIKGELSFIGPRPLLPEYLPYYSDIQKMRHSVKPGITGLAQVKGGNLLEWDERLALDIEYVHDESIGLDMEIWLMTLKYLVKKKQAGALYSESFIAYTLKKKP